MRLVIEGHHLPGRSCGSHDDVHVGVQRGREPVELVPADATEARWEIDVEVVHRDGERDFRGPEVQGKPGERFVYLTWGSVAGGSFEMFRRAKLMLADLPAGDEVTVDVDLTDECGMPRCARLRAPAIAFVSSAGPQE